MAAAARDLYALFGGLDGFTQIFARLGRRAALFRHILRLAAYRRQLGVVRRFVVRDDERGRDPARRLDRIHRMDDVDAELRL